MANEEHLDRLRDAIRAKDIRQWNAWRNEYPSLRIDLSGANLSGADLTGVYLSGMYLSKVNLSEANLSGAHLVSADLTSAHLHNANLSGANLTSAGLSDADLTGADLSGANLSGADLLGANLSSANLTNAKLIEAKLTDANLVKADLSDADLAGANLDSADLSRARLFNAKLIATNLSKAKFRDAILTDAILLGANLSDANLTDVILLGANLSDANLSGANFARAELAAANLSGADLSGAILFGANLIYADLTDAILGNTRFSSRAELNALRTPLIEEQLAGAIFADEEEFFQDEQKRKDFFNEDTPCLRIRFTDDSPWMPSDLGFLLLALHVGYARLVYLATTEEQDKEAIEARLKRGFSLDMSQEIGIQKIESGSLEVLLALLDPYSSVHLVVVLQVLGTAFLGGMLTVCKGYELIKRGQNYDARLPEEKEKLRAEARKLDAEARKFEAETERIKSTPPLPAPLDPAMQKALANQAREGLEAEASEILAKLTVNVTVRDNPDLLHKALDELVTLSGRLASQGKSIPEIELPKMPDFEKKE